MRLTHGLFDSLQDAALLAYEKQKRDAERANRQPTTFAGLLGLLGLCFRQKKRHAKIYAAMEDDPAAPISSPPDSPHMPIPVMSPVERVKGQLLDIKKHREEMQVKKAEEKRMVKQ